MCWSFSATSRLTHALNILNCRQLLSLEKEAEEKKKLEVQLKKAQEAQQILKQTNEDLHNKLKTGKELKEKLHATREITHTEVGKKRAKKQYETYLSTVRHTLARGCTKPKYSDIKIVVSQEFKLSLCFGVWYKKFLREGTAENRSAADPRYFAFLFASLSHESPTASSTNPICEQQLQLVKAWRVVFPKDCIQDIYVGDDGGPTRHFFDRVWLQIGALQVPFPSEDGNGNPIALFEQNSGGCVPTTDEMIEHRLRNCSEEQQEATKKQIEAYYCAIGRLIAHAMLLSQEDSGPIIIASHVLPRLYQNGKSKSIDSFLDRNAFLT
jgi:hypothetical protein